MFRLFIKVLLLFSAITLAARWTVDKLVSTYVISDRQRVVPGLVDVHLGSLRVIASELRDAREDKRDRRWRIMREESRYPLELRPVSELSASDRGNLKKPDGFIYKNRNQIVDYLGVAYDEENYIRLGPISDQTSKLIEDEISGWMRLLSTKIQRSDAPDKLIKDFNNKSKVIATLESSKLIPEDVYQMLRGGRESVFFSKDNDFFVAKLIPDREEVLVVGPLPKVKDLAQSITSRSLLIWMLILACCLGWLILNLSRKFKRVELAAKRISNGEFDARVDETNAGEAKELAKIFNIMAAKTEASIRSKRELLQVISHELRTPLSRLRFATELLQNPSNEQMKTSRMRILERSIDELESLVQEIIDFVVHEDKKPKQNFQWIKVEKELQEIIDSLKLQHPNLSIGYRFIDEPRCEFVYADLTAFQRVIGNLTNNAVRYAKSKLLLQVYHCKSDSIHPHSDQPNQGCICVEVEDDGPGIPAEKRIEVLSPFVRLEDSSPSLNSDLSKRPANSFQTEQQIHTNSSKIRRIPTGLGLGLSIVDRVLKQHGGSLDIETSSLGGCLIRTHWPLPINADPSIEPLAETQSA